MNINKKLKLLGKRLTFVSPILILVVSLSSGVANASSLGYAASDVLGQTDGSGNPIFTTSTTDNGQSPINNTSLDYPEGDAIDLVHHRLFVADDGNNRVLVYNLDSNNNLVSHAANNVLGQSSMSGNSTGSGATGMRFPEDPTYDPVDNWLFVPDTGNNRILVFNLNNGITDGMPAWHVLGQNSFSGTGPDYQGSVTAAGMDNPYGGIAYDTTHHLLFVGDANNGRVLVFDLSNGITDGMPATYVIGQSSTTATGCSAISATSMGTPFGIAYDAEHNRLFVGDDGSCVSNTIEMSRVGIYNLNNLATGMAASFELGQPDLNTGGDLSPAANVINSPEDVIYDPANQQLFVQDDEYNRILVFDVASVSNFENAVAVIGQPNFTSDDYSCNPSQTDQCDAEGVNDAFDPVNNRLYLSDADDDRVLVFNFINVTTPAGSLKTATAGTSYSQAFQTINSQGTVSFAVTSGSLPPGLSLNTTTGVISGTPTTTGTYTFELTAYDNNGAIGTFEDDPSYSITVNPSIPDTGYGQPINNHTITYLAIISVLSTGLGLGLASRRRQSNN